MINENSFDDVHDCQEAFRNILYAISNPGRIASISEQANKLQTEKSAVLTIALTLLDKETSYCVADNEDFAKTISELTYSSKVNFKSSDKSAGIIFVTEECGPDEINGIIGWANPGTLIEPHTSSILVVVVDKFNDTETCRLKGPGINEAISVGLPEYAREWIRQRDLIGYEFPTGIDIYFVTASGEIMIIPRKVSLKDLI